MSARKKLFIKQLAKFLAENEAAKSIELEVESNAPIVPVRPRWAKEWADLRNASPLFGYMSVEEAERRLEEFLS